MIFKVVGWCDENFNLHDLSDVPAEIATVKIEEVPNGVSKGGLVVPEDIAKILRNMIAGKREYTAR